MSCKNCEKDLPYLRNYPKVGGSQERQANVLKCEKCGALFEMQAMNWGAPLELDEALIKEYYPELM